MMKNNIAGLGYRFHPTDHEMLLLLRAKAEGKQTPPIIIERDIYGENATPWMLFQEDDPWEIEVDNSGRSKKDTKVLYVITRLVKISKLKTVRIAGCGTWDGQTGKSDIRMNGRKIGYKKMLNFRANETSNAFGNWIMHEYHLDGDFLNGLSNDHVLKGLSNDYVICRIKWLNSTTSGKSCTPYSNMETEASEVQAYSSSADCTTRVQETTKRKNPATFQENICSGRQLFKLPRVDAAIETSSRDSAAQPVPVVEELPELLVPVNGEESMTNNEDVFSGVKMDGQNDGLPEIDFDNWEVKDLDQYFNEEKLSDDCQGVQCDSIVPTKSNLDSSYTASSVVSQQEHSVEPIGSDNMAVSNPNPIYESSAVAEQEDLELLKYQGIRIGSDIAENEFGDLNSTSWLDNIALLQSPPSSHELGFEDLWH